MGRKLLGNLSLGDLEGLEGENKIDNILKIVDREPEDGIKIISGKEFSDLNIDINSNMIIIDVDKNNISSIIDILTKIYEKEFKIKIINNLNSGQETVYSISLGEVNTNGFEGSNVIFLTKIDKNIKRKYECVLCCKTQTRRLKASHNIGGAVVSDLF